MRGTPVQAYRWLAVPGGLLGYLLLGGAVRPGFTDYWGYLVVQAAVALALLALIEAWLAPDGGLSWSAHAVAGVALAADVFGNTARWYARSDTYDQVVHFLTIAAITRVLADLLDSLRRRGTLPWSLTTPLIAAIIAIGLGLAWEGYEYVGDVVLRTGRNQGRVDTALDIVCDVVGALTVVAVLRRRQALSSTQPTHPESLTRRSTRRHALNVDVEPAVNPYVRHGWTGHGERGSGDGR